MTAQSPSSLAAGDASGSYRALRAHVTVCLRFGLHCQLSFQDPLHGHVLTAIACGLSLVLTALPAPLPLLLHSCGTHTRSDTHLLTGGPHRWDEKPSQEGQHRKYIFFLNKKIFQGCFRCTAIKLAVPTPRTLRLLQTSNLQM